MKAFTNKGFTLIELSIVLVIIGLIVGGVLVGQDLISGAAMRAQIAQFEKYNTAVNTFRAKYNALPGDIQAAQAATFGFVTRAGTQGRGDGDGILEGYDYTASASGVCGSGTCPFTGEPMFFWEDLSSAHLINDGVYNSFADTNCSCYWRSDGLYGAFMLSLIFPAGKIGAANFIYAYSAGGFNYFTLLAVQQVGGSGVIGTAAPGLTVQQAYIMDKKIDDGLPQSGKITARAYTNTTQWTNGWMGGGWQGGNYGWLNNGAMPGTAAPSSTTTCYDNGGSASATMQYSTEVSYGSGVNCALSFQFQ